MRFPELSCWLCRSVAVLSIGIGLLASCRSGAPTEPTKGHPGSAAGTSSILGSGVRTQGYPETATVDVVERLHGVDVADPYRWLEDLDSPETRAWIEAQNRVTFAFLEGIPERKSIRERLRKLWDHERYGIPTKRGERYFFTKNDGLENQSVLYVADSLDGEPRVLLDPNGLSDDGTVALAGLEPSEDGRLLAYGLSTAGSDWEEWRVRDVETGKDRTDLLRWVKFSDASWTRDGRGFYYSRYDEPAVGALHEELNYFQKLYYHRLGTPQAEDTLVYWRPDEKEWTFEGVVTDDGRYLVITISQGTDPRTRVYYKGLGDDSAPVVRLLDDFDAAYDFVGNDGPVFWFRTDLDASRGRVIAVDTSAPERSRWKEIVPETSDALVGASVAGDCLLATYLHDAHSQVKRHRLDGRPLGDLELPGLGTALGFRGRRSDAETFYAFTSFTSPTTIYRLDVRSGASKIHRRPEVDFDPERYETRQIFAESKDGTRIPIFVSHRKGLERNGRNPTLLYGYGGFKISLTPSFSVTSLVWMELGGVYAVANTRGGGEYGEDWHRAGTKLQKQNVFDDFVAAAEHLIQEAYTSREKLAIQGGSNGGLLVGAALTQRPDLFAAALPAVGVMDMLRFHKFTIGWAWTSDYGSPESAEDFEALRAYSPLHNIRKGTRYPATLITTADHDDRVVPSHSFKFAAALQAAQSGPAPVLIRVETRAGHGAGKPTAKLIEEAADRLAFLVKVLGVEPGT